jgi:hypothetical protein
MVDAKASSTAGSSSTPPRVRASGTTSGADASTPPPGDAPEFKPGDAVSVEGRTAFYLYRRGDAAVVRFPGERGSRVVPFAKLPGPAAAGRPPGGRASPPRT